MLHSRVPICSVRSSKGRFRCEGIRVDARGETSAQGARPKGLPNDNRAQSDARYRIWQAMRVLRRFTLSQLAATSETNYNIAKFFTRDLTRVDYVKTVVPARSYRGRDGEAVRVLLIDNGPKPPRRRANGTVFDPNVDKPGVRRSGDGGNGVARGMG